MAKVRWAVATMVMAACLPVMAEAQSPPAAPIYDTALVIAVDVSQSVDANRYRMQMEGIASAFEDSSVVAAITGGYTGKIVVTLVAWADEANIVVPWTEIASADDAARLAQSVRNLKQVGGEFTCMARMLRILPIRVLPNVPAPARRTVVDVSGDGIDNCNRKSESDEARDSLINEGAVINGLPIIIAGENDIVGSGAYRAPSYGLNNLGPDTDTTTLDAWYQEHVIGGPGAFMLVAKGYEDFGRAFRQKFVTEISDSRTP